MASIENYSQKNRYVRILIDMGANTEGVSKWYSDLQANLEKAGIMCSIEANVNGKAILITEAPYAADMIRQMRQTIMRSFSEDLDPKKTKESLLRTALETPIYLRTA